MFSHTIFLFNLSSEFQCLVCFKAVLIQNALQIKTNLYFFFSSNWSLNMDRCPQIWKIQQNYQFAKVMVQLQLSTLINLQWNQNDTEQNRKCNLFYTNLTDAVEKPWGENRLNPTDTCPSPDVCGRGQSSFLLSEAA